MKRLMKSGSLVSVIAIICLSARTLQAEGPQEADGTKRPFQVQTNFEIPGGTPGTRLVMATIPKHDRLVIKYFSCDADVPGGQFLGVSLTTNGGGAAHFSFLAAKLGTIPPTGEDVLIISQQVRIFADPTTNVELEIERSSSAGGVLGSCTLAGELVKVDDRKE
jgi:hypothetical protein